MDGGRWSHAAASNRGQVHGPHAALAPQAEQPPDDALAGSARLRGTRCAPPGRRECQLVPAGKRWCPQIIHRECPHRHHSQGAGVWAPQGQQQ